MEAIPFTREFGRRVERRRRLMDLTQQEVATVLGVNRSHIAHLEAGTVRSMRLEHVALLADILQTSTDYLFQRTNVDPGPIPDDLCPAVALSCGGVTLPRHAVASPECHDGAEYSMAAPSVC